VDGEGTGGAAVKERTGATKVMPLAPHPKDHGTEIVERVRATLKKKIKSKARLSAVFAKLDADGSNSMSKAEFGKLIRAVLKPAPKQELLAALWSSACARIHLATGEVKAELSVVMLGEWLFDEEERDDAQLLADTLQETDQTVKIAVQKDEKVKRGQIKVNPKNLRNWVPDEDAQTLN